MIWLAWLRTCRRGCSDGPRRDRRHRPDLERARLFEAVVALVEWAAQDRSLLMLVEDIHIADAPSLELIGYVARRISSLPVLFILTRRELPRAEHADRLEHALRARGRLHAELVLGPLGPECVAELARRAAALGEGDVAQVVEAADGNALLTVETARAISRGELAPAASFRSAVRGAFGSLSVPAAGLPSSPPWRPANWSAVRSWPCRSMSRRSRDRRAGERASGGARTQCRLSPWAAPRRRVRRSCQSPTAPRCTSVGADAAPECERGGGVRRAAEVARHLRMAGRDATRSANSRARPATRARWPRCRRPPSICARRSRWRLDRADLLLELGEVQAWRGLRAEAEAAFERALTSLQGAPVLDLARAWLRRARWYHGSVCVPAAVRESCAEVLRLLDAPAPATVAERREALAALAWAEAIAGSVAEAERLLAELHDLTLGARR